MSALVSLAIPDIVGYSGQDGLEAGIQGVDWVTAPLREVMPGNPASALATLATLKAAM